MALERIEAGTPEMAALQALHVRCADYVEATTGLPPRDDEAARLLAGLPPGKTPADKQVLGVRRDGALVGVVELLAGYPGPTDWYVGLLMLEPAARGAGLGAAVFREVAGRVAAAGGRTLHLVVREDNPRAVAFWTGQGFTLVDRRVQDLGTKVNRVLKMVRPL
ncbi:MAG TPA: GNAT family N-acetyltransferase [Polyangia bacterium]|nr:GNAT family N-acetyltransferase [Polyangia bacterium]